MLNKVPVMVNVLDVESSLDGDASFTGEKRQILEVAELLRHLRIPVLTSNIVAVTHQYRRSWRNPVYWSELH